MSLGESIVVLLILFAGCAGAPVDRPELQTSVTTEQPTTRSPVGFIEGEKVSNTPSGAEIINYNKSSISESPKLKKAVKMAEATGESNILIKNSTELKNVKQNLPGDKLYQGDRFGYYISYQNDIIRLKIVEYPI